MKANPLLSPFSLSFIKRSCSWKKLFKNKYFQRAMFKQQPSFPPITTLPWKKSTYSWSLWEMLNSLARPTKNTLHKTYIFFVALPITYSLKSKERWPHLWKPCETHIHTLPIYLSFYLSIFREMSNSFNEQQRDEPKEIKNKMEVWQYLKQIITSENLYTCILTTQTHIYTLYSYSNVKQL